MTAPLEFYFDFSSPYGYLASERIDALAARFGRKVRWRPILLGVLLRETGGTPPTQVPAKRSYFLCDFARSARFMGIPYAQPQHGRRAVNGVAGGDLLMAGLKKIKSDRSHVVP